VEAGAAAGLVVNLDGAAVLLNDTVCDRQAEARPFASSLGGEEGIVNAVDVFRVDAVPAVDHVDLHPALVLVRRPDFEHAAGAHGVARVDEQVQEDLLQLARIAGDGRRRIVEGRANLEARLVSRFDWGLTAELQPPDTETRVAILRKKAQSLEITLTKDVLEYLAERVRTNVRRLEGALTRVASYASLNGTQPTIEKIEHLLKDILQEEARRSITIDQIQKRVAEHFDVRLADMTSKRRPANIAFPRQIAMYLARELTKGSLSEIGDAFGGRDHGTVLHAHRLVKKRIRADEKVRGVITYLDGQLNR